MKWIGWLLKLSITIVMVSLLTVVTTGYVVNQYVGSLLSSYNISMSSPTPSIGGVIKDMLGFGGGSNSNNQVNSKVAELDKKTGNRSVDDSGNNSVESGVHSGTTGSQPTGTTSPDNGNEHPTSGDSENHVPEDALPVMGGISAGESQQDKQVVVSPDDLVAKKDGLDSTEKEEVFAILMSKLPEEEMRKLTDAMENGLTETEILNIEQVLSKYLDKTEYAKVIAILQK